MRLANEQGVQARARIAELERAGANLNTELNAANEARKRLQADFDEAKSEIDKRQSELAGLSAELENATNAAKDAEPPAQEGDSASASSDAWKPQGRFRLEAGHANPVFPGVMDR